VNVDFARAFWKLRDLTPIEIPSFFILVVNGFQANADIRSWRVYLIEKRLSLSKALGAPLVSRDRWPVCEAAKVF
jgi:hypothetical protein